MAVVDHFEALFNSTYQRWFDLDGPALVRITKVQRDVELTLPGGAKKKSPVLSYELVQGTLSEVKPLVLNKTNGNLIAKILGEKPSQWIGKEIVLFQDTTNLRGEPTKCIRVRAKKGT